MEQIIVIYDLTPTSPTNKALIRCPICGNYTTSYTFKSNATINKTNLLCRTCKHPLTIVEDLCKKKEKRLEFHKNV